MERTVNLDSGSIWIYDDMFSYAWRDNFYHKVVSSKYTTLGLDNEFPEQLMYRSIFAPKNYHDAEEMGWWDSKGWNTVKHHFDGMDIKQIRINLSTLNDYNRIHSDGINTKTLIYYPNMEWDVTWGGQTFFTNEDATEIEFSLAYKPGRLIVFDGGIPHCIGAPTVAASGYRYSFVIQFFGNSDND